MATYHAFVPGGLSAEIRDAPSTKRARTAFLDYMSRNKHIKWSERSEVRRHIKVNKSFPGETEADVVLEYDLVAGGAEGPVPPVGEEEPMKIEDIEAGGRNIEEGVRSVSTRIAPPEPHGTLGIAAEEEPGDMVEAAQTSPRRQPMPFKPFPLPHPSPMGGSSTGTLEDIRRTGAEGLGVEITREGTEGEEWGLKQPESTLGNSPIARLSRRSGGM